MNDEPIWVPSLARVECSIVEAFRQYVSHADGLALADTCDLHRFSCTEPGRFWRHLWTFAEIVGNPGEVDMHSPTFATTEFFPEGTIDVVATMLHGDVDEVIVIECDEAGTIAHYTRGELHRRTAALAAHLRQSGVRAGDVVAGYSTTSEPTLTMMLATAACGAVYTSVSAEFGADSVIDRFSQVRPKVLLAIDSYQFSGREHDVTRRVDEIVRRLDSIELVVTTGSPVRNSVRRGVKFITYDDAVSDPAARLVTATVGFNDPGWILYSSGTTGRPKCIVHRAGGVVLKHLSEMLLHCDIRRADRVFYYTTPSWMMWNWLASGLAAGASIVLYNGSPLAPDPTQLIRMAEREEVTYFGTSPSFLDALRRSDADIAEIDLSAIRTVAVTGAPMSPTTARYAASWGSDVHVLSKSGGTDLCGGLVTGDPTKPSWGGEIQAPAFGCDIAVVDHLGLEVDTGAKGELVSRTPFPSMPIRFVDDIDGARLRAAYFDRFPDCWYQADFVSETSHGGYVIHGRSDTTLNAHGVRIGTAEIYSQLDRIDWIKGAAAVEQNVDSSSHVVLLVELAPSATLDDAQRREIRSMLRERCSPRHVPAVIEQVDALPRTMNDKLSEIAVADAVNQRDPRGTEALTNPECLELLRVLGARLARKVAP